MITVDLRTLVVPQSTRVWRLFPGSDYKFLSFFLNNETAFLDLPAFEFPQTEKMAADGELLARMLASEKTRENIAALGVDAVAITDWEQFSVSRRSAARMARVSAIINFYQEAKLGDYVVVPTTLSERRIHVGRFATSRISHVRYRYGEHKIPARRVQWLASIDEGRVSSALSGSLRHQHPFSLIERSRFLEVFALANASYKFGERTVATVFNRKDDFLDSDSALMGVIAKLAAAACAAADSNGQLGDTLKAVVAAPPIEYTCSQESDIHSEGFTRFLSGALTPLVIAAVLAVLLAGDIQKSPAQVSADLQQVEIINSLAPGDPCIPPVDNATKMILNSVDINTTYELCKAAHAAKARAGLEPSATAQ